MVKHEKKIQQKYINRLALGRLVPDNTVGQHEGYPRICLVGGWVIKKSFFIFFLKLQKGKTIKLKPLIKLNEPTRVLGRVT